MSLITPEVASKTLYFGNLSPHVNENLLISLVEQFGVKCLSCKMIRETINDPYCFIEFASCEEARLVLSQLNQVSIFEKKLKVNWAAVPKVDSTTEYFSIFVGDLSPEIDSAGLLNAFRHFGEISDCKVITDPHTFVSKGFGFVSFLHEEDAARAISQMNCQWIGGRPIRTNWAARKVGFGSVARSYAEISEQTTSTNTTVYVGGVHPGLMTEDHVRAVFTVFGHILSVRVFQDKGYAFVQYKTKESAVRAIQAGGSHSIAGCPLKCSWGKENPSNFQVPYNFYGVGYEQPQNMQYPPRGNYPYYY